MIIHVDEKQSQRRFEEMLSHGTESHPIDPEKARKFVRDREMKPCPTCLGLSTRENSRFDCVRCGNRGEIEVDITRELTDSDPHPR